MSAILALVVIVGALAGEKLNEGQVLDVNFVLNAVTLIALFYIGTVYLRSRKMQEAERVADRTLTIQSTEIEALSQSKDRLEEANARLTHDLAEAKQKWSADVARMEGVVDQLRQENDQLRRLVMLDSVPPAMAQALEMVVNTVMQNIRELHKETTDALAAHFDQQSERQRLFMDEQVREQLHPIAQGVQRLLAEPKTPGG